MYTFHFIKTVVVRGFTSWRISESICFYCENEPASSTVNPQTNSYGQQKFNGKFAEQIKLSTGSIHTHLSFVEKKTNKQKLVGLGICAVRAPFGYGHVKCIPQQSLKVCTKNIHRVRQARGTPESGTTLARPSGKQNHATARNAQPHARTATLPLRSFKFGRGERRRRRGERVDCSCNLRPVGLEFWFQTERETDRNDYTK